MPDTPAGGIAPAVKKRSVPAPRLEAEALRLVIPDDVTLYRDGMTLLLSGRDDMRVVGVGTADRDGLRLVREQQPDVVLLVASATPLFRLGLRLIRHQRLQLTLTPRTL